MLLFRSYSTLPPPSPNPQHGPVEGLCSPSDHLCITSPPNIQGSGNLCSPAVLLHSRAERTSHTLLYKPSSSLISPVAHKPRHCTCPDVPERGKPETGVRKSLFQGQAMIQRDNPHKVQPPSSVLVPHLRAEGKGGEADFDPPRNSLHHHKASRQHQGLPVLFISL